MNIPEVLRQNNFKFNKSLGQNFITDTNLLSAIVSDSGVGPDDTVIEIGTGAGTLTACLARAVRFVYTFEIDEKLKPVLETTLGNLGNVKTIFLNILDLNDAEIFERIGQGPFSVVANIPYYITSPLIMRFLESGLNIKSVTVMTAFEVAKRITARPGTKDYSALTAAVNLYGNARILRNVSKKMFYPMPEVDSAVIRIDILKDKFDCDKSAVLTVIKAAFSARRKTLQNNLSAYFKMEKEKAREILNSAGLSENVRGEELGVNEYIKISKEVNKSK